MVFDDVIKNNKNLALSLPRKEHNLNFHFSIFFNEIWKLLNGAIEYGLKILIKERKCFNTTLSTILNNIYYNV